jgi:hypothetical protein
MARPIFLRCSLCGKKLIERKRNGLFRFVFGRNFEREERPPVEMQIHGSLKMRCLRRSCRTEHPDHWEVLNYLPVSYNRSERNSNSINEVETGKNNNVRR